MTELANTNGANFAFANLFKHASQGIVLKAIAIIHAIDGEYSWQDALFSSPNEVAKAQACFGIPKNNVLSMMFDSNACQRAREALAYSVCYQRLSRDLQS